MAGCIVCGDPTKFRRCRDCQKADRRPNGVRESDWQDCPQCGGLTSGQGINCYQCRTGGGCDD